MDTERVVSALESAIDLAEKTGSVLVKTTPDVAKEAINMIKEEKTMNKWHIVSEDGNPKKAGTYFVMLIYPEWEDGEDTGRRGGCVGTRDLMNAEDARGWIMQDQPEEGLVWTDQVGSTYGESVYAWLELEEAEMPKFPDGVIVDE